MSYSGMIDELRQQLKEKDATIASYRAKSRDQEIASLQKQVEILQSFQQNSHQMSSSNNTSSHSRVPFADFEDSMRKFSGEDNYPVQRFIEDFEGAADVFEWSEVQKIIFCKKLSTGVAKLAIRSESGLNTWTSLKEFLLREFDKRENSAELHEMLRKRKKKASESFVEYFYTMRELGAKAKLEEPAVIKYIIDGIEDDERNKMSLYGAKTLFDLKERLLLYGIVYDKSVTRSKFNPSTKSRGQKITRCYNCGSSSHISTSCPHKNEGVKCFSCNNFGHKSISYPNKVKRDLKDKTVALIKDDDLQEVEMSKMVTLNGVEMLAYIDTGSDLTFIREGGYRRLGYPPLSKPIVFRGIGSEPINTFGSFQAKLLIDGHEYAEKVHVVAQEILPKRLLLGKTLLRQLQLHISPTAILMSPAVERDFPDCWAVTSFDTTDMNLSHIEAKHRERVQELVTDYKPKADYVAKDMQMKIILRDETPIFQPPRRLSKTDCDYVKG